MSLSVLRDPSFLEHDAGHRHPERAERLVAIDRALAESGLPLVEVAARAATRAELLAVHEAAYLEELDRAEGQRVLIDPDTATSPGSHRAAMLAAGGTVELAVRVAEGTAPPGIALVRPPGHHATRARGMGFCLLNNAAIAARALIDRGLAERVAIYDFDVHHGNGTEDIFYEDPRVLYLSTHQWPLYPGTGRATHTGRGAGEGTTVNVPLPAGTDDEVLLRVHREVLEPAVERFAPDFILLSAGFDGHAQDPLGGFALSAAGYSELAARWRALAERRAGGRIAAVLEGGYDLAGLSESVVAMLSAWAAG